jgi:hypothetical protein
MGCQGSKAATLAPAPGLLKEDKKQQELKSKASNEQAANLQTATDADIKAAIAVLGADDRKKLSEVLSSHTKSTGESPNKTLAEYIAMSAIATPVELEAALVSVSTEDRVRLQEAIASLKSPSVAETKVDAKLKEERPNDDAQPDASQQVTTEIGTHNIPLEENNVETELAEEKPINDPEQDDSQQITTEVGTLSTPPIEETTAEAKLEEEEKPNHLQQDDSHQATAEADTNDLVEVEQKRALCCWS